MLLPADWRDSNTDLSAFKQNSFNVKIAKKKVMSSTSLVNPIIGLERPLEKILRKGEYKVIKCHYTPGDNVNAGCPGYWYAYCGQL